jgi:hypothetical protein
MYNNLNKTHLFYDVAMTEFHFSRRIERGHDFASGDESESFDALEIGVFDGHDSRVGEQLFGVVVNQLSEN